MKTRFVSCLCLAAALALVGRTALAGGVVRDPLPAEKFVAHALAQGILEVKLGERAEKHASNADVKEFARKMVTDHKKCNDQLMDIAKYMKLAVVQGLDKESKEVWGRFDRLEGASFDRAYMKHQVDAHKRAIQLFEAQAK